MAHGITPSERFVTALCERSFLRLWTHPNPKGKKNKELCDCLVVCGSHIIIISVKECKYKATGDKTGRERWEKDAIDKSASQIWGAERWLQTVDQVVRHDGRSISLPAQEKLKYHRISVSLGGKGDVPIKWGDLGNGFVHICDEYSVSVVFNALDTITDLVEFLSASEELVTRGTSILFDGGGIEDLVALYLLRDRSFDFSDDSGKHPDMVIPSNGLWKGFYESDAYKAIQKDFRGSYKWDRLIDHYTDALLTNGMFDVHSKEVTKNELALVEMALQPRIYRAALAEAFMEFRQKSEMKVEARVVKAFRNTAFVFLIGESADRVERGRKLVLRCLVVRGRMPGVTKVVGIAIDRPGKTGYSSDIAYIHMPEWTVENESQVAGIQADLGLFRKCFSGQDNSP